MAHKAEREGGTLRITKGVYYQGLPVSTSSTLEGRSGESKWVSESSDMDSKRISSLFSVLTCEMGVIVPLSLRQGGGNWRPDTEAGPARCACSEVTFFLWFLVCCEQG